MVFSCFLRRRDGVGAWPTPAPGSGAYTAKFARGGRVSPPRRKISQKPPPPLDREGGSGYTTGTGVSRRLAQLPLFETVAAWVAARRLPLFLSVVLDQPYQGDQLDHDESYLTDITDTHDTNCDRHGSPPFPGGQSEEVI